MDAGRIPLLAGTGNRFCVCGLHGQSVDRHHPLSQTLGEDSIREVDNARLSGSSVACSVSGTGYFSRSLVKTIRDQGHELRTDRQK